MSRFIDNAREIFEAAESSSAAGCWTSEYMILVGTVTGGIQLIADSDWSLSATQQEHGAELAYRVRNVEGRITVDGCEGRRTCRLEVLTAPRAAQFLLNAAPAWHGGCGTRLLG